MNTKPEQRDTHSVDISTHSMSPTIQEMQDFQRQQTQLQGYSNQLYHGYYATPGQFAQTWPASAWMTAAAGSTSPEHTSTSPNASSTSNSSPNPHQEQSVHQLQINEATAAAAATASTTQGAATEQEQQIYHPQMNHLLTQHQVYHPQAFQVSDSSHSLITRN